jgi:hypothetical protein
VDILEYIPDILEGQFAIMMDDYERLGEKNTVDMIMKKLSDNGIKAKKGLYRGEKDMCIIVPDTMDFMFTM